MSSEPIDRSFARSAPRSGGALVALAVAAVFAGAALERFSLAGDETETKQIANPIEQRNEMIRLLKSIDGRLLELKEVLAQKK